MRRSFRDIYTWDFSKKEKKNNHLIYLSIVGPNGLDGLIMLCLPLQRNMTWIRLGTCLGSDWNRSKYNFCIYLFVQDPVFFITILWKTGFTRFKLSYRFVTVQSQVVGNFWLDFLCKKMQPNSFKSNIQTRQSGLTFLLLSLYIFLALFIRQLVGFAVPIITLSEVVYIYKTVMIHISAIINISPRNCSWTIEYSAKGNDWKLSISKEKIAHSID